MRVNEPMAMLRKLLIFTDMDGSLLDHSSYSHAAADPLLRQLEQHSIPVIPATSKTRNECLALRQELRNRHPFIVENGAAVFIPQGYFDEAPAGSVESDGYWIKSFSAPRAHWLKLIEQHRSQFPEAFTSFAESSIEAIVAMTGLSEADARAASQREYGEPVKWLGSQQQRKQFIEVLTQAGATVVAGGRFLHVSGNCSKGMALTWLIAEYQRHHPDSAYFSLAIGDSQNDVAMLQVADYALIIRSPHHPAPTLKRSHNLYISEAYGPHGWVEGVSTILHPFIDTPTI